MIPILYEKNEKQFLTYGLGEVAFIKAKVTRVRNGEYTFEGEYPINGILAKELKVGRFIKANAGYRTKFQTFEIARVIKDSNNKLVVYANHISYQLLYDVLERDVNISSTSAEGALTIWKNNLITDMQWDVWSDIGSTNSTTLNVRNMTNGRLALVGKAGSIIDTWGGEFEFDNTTIKLHKQYGRKYPTTIEYGKNLISAEVEEDIMSTYTSVRSYAVKFTNEEENSNEEIYFMEKQFIDSKHVDKYSHRRVLLIDASSSFKQEEEITQEKLEKLANDYIKNNRVGIPKTKIKLKYLDLSKTLDYQEYKRMEEVELCDIVPVYYSNIGLLDSEAKVNEVVYDVLLERNESVDVGVIGKSYSQSVLDNMVSMVENLESKTNRLDSIPYLLNGMGNRIWYEQPSDNMEHKKGDTWIEKNGVYYRMHVWNGEFWEVIIDTENDKQEFEEKFQKLNAQTEQLNQQIAESERKADEALEQLNAHNNAITEHNDRIVKLNQDFNNVPTTISKMISERGLVDGTYVENKVDTLNGEWSAKITKIETLVNSNNRNYFYVRDIQTRAIKRSTLGRLRYNLSPNTTYTVSTDAPRSKEGTYRFFAGVEDAPILHAQTGVGHGYPRKVTTGADGILDVMYFNSNENNILTMQPGHRVMITIGENERPWQIAPEDDNTAESYKILQAEYKADIEGLRGTLSSLENNTLSNREFEAFKSNDYQVNQEETRLRLQSIEQNQNSTNSEITALNLKAGTIEQSISNIRNNPSGTITGYNVLVNDVRSMKQTIADEESIARMVMGSSVFQTEITDLKTVGGRNLIRNSTNFKAWLPYARNIINSVETTLNGLPAYKVTGAGTSEQHPNELLIMKGFALTIQDGTEWLTAQILVRNDLTNLPLEFQFGGIDSPRQSVQPGEVKRLIFTGRHPVGGTISLNVMCSRSNYANANFTIAYVKAERGKVATDHDLAPEDNETTLQSIQSKITQTSDSISLGLFNEKGLVSGAQFGKSGAKIKGSLINLDGTVGMNDAFANNIFTKNIQAENLRAFTAVLNSLKAITVDVNNITGSKSEFLKSLWQSIGNMVYIDGNGIDVRRTDGTNALKMGVKGLELRNHRGVLAGLIGWGQYSNEPNSSVMRISTDTGTELSLGVGYSNIRSSYNTSILFKEYQTIHQLNSHFNSGVTINGLVNMKNSLQLSGDINGVRIQPGTMNKIQGIYIEYAGGGIWFGNGDFAVKQGQYWVGLSSLVNK